ncbi:MAG: CusA/CzcA family heavy metal efflux RND transporter [Chitinophagaceae bacterium]|nr:CusA/CzcA family heavy metal efflux RND transporter [Chitinophagaceae bacterium]MCW5927909.1 CusA/CzcA family heavy metal efflux RND transporter [Chitinophagaceae bacterium]
MLNAIIRFSVRNKLIIGLFTLILVIAGVINLRTLSIDALPDITSNQVQVITVSPSLAAPEVERLITFPLEQATANIPGIVEMRSISRFGLSVLTVVFNDKTDVYWARQQISERLSLAREQIPSSAGNPELAPVTTGIGEVYQYVIRPQKGYEGKYDLTELRSIQDWIVRRQLLGTPGVADVSSFGGYLKQYEIAVQPTRLKSMGVTIDDIFNALEKNNENSGGAYIEKGPAALFIRTEGLAENVGQLEKIFIRHTAQGIPVYIKDVAEVRIGHAIRYGALTYRDQGEVAGAVVLMLKGANASEVVSNVKEKIEQIRKTLPEGIILETFYDRTKMVDNSMNTVKKNLLEGALIVIFVLVVFLGNARAGLIVASVIPLSMLFAVTMMNIFGISGNLMSLGALDFGLIVDGAVIIVEAILHKLHHGKSLSGINRISQQQLNGEVEQASGRMMNSAVFGQIIILIVYLPILSLTGIEGKMFRPMAQTVSLALIGAFLLSLTYVPMMTSLVLSKKLSHKDTWADKMVKKIQHVYKPLLHKALAYPKTVIAICLLLLGLSFFIMSRLGGEFIPELNEGDFAVDARLMTGSSLTETIKTTQKAVTILEQRFPEVEKIVTRIGASEIPTDPMPLEMTDIMISLKPPSQWTSAKTTEELADKMSKALKDIPGLTAGFQFPVQMRFNELISGARQDVVCKIFGEDLEQLSLYAKELGSLAGSVAGARDIYIETVTGLPQIVVNYNREAMARYQLHITDLNRIIRSAFAGETAGIIYEKERRYGLAVRLEGLSRTDISDVQQLLIATPAGLQIPLYQVADITIKEGPNQIQRENAHRRIIVGFNVRDRDVESVVNELQHKVNANMKLNSGYYIKYGGQFENMVEAKQRLSIAVPAALLLILLMLYFAFGSLKYGLLIFSAIPLSAIGGVFSLWIRGLPFSISAGIGFIALFGVAVLNGIVLIAEFNRLKKEGLTNIREIIERGTLTRLRPVLMTASVASLGFLPMAISHSVGAEVQRPLATVVIGGLITATLLTLVVLPVLYRWMETGSTGKKITKPVTIIAGLLLVSATVHAQQPLTLEQVLQMADINNLQLKAARQQIDYWQQLQSSTFDPPKTETGAEYGGISSAQNDTRFFATQSFSLPVVYKRQRQLYEAQGHTQEQMLKWKQADLNREITIVFYRLAELTERQKLLQRLDSIYSRFQTAATLRREAGESNLLEKTTADAYLQQLQLQQQAIEDDLVIEEKRMQLLLNTGERIIPAYTDLKMKPPLVDTSLATQHPEVQYNKLREQTARAFTQTEKARLHPEFSIGYSNQSIIGYQSTDGISQKYYSAGHRFHVATLGIGIPLFNGAAKARIKAAQINEGISSLETQAALQSVKYTLLQWQQAYIKQQKQVHYFEQTGLMQSERIIFSANLSFEQGEINYLEWTVLMNNAVSIQLQYLDALQAYNRTIIELQYLNSK